MEELREKKEDIYKQITEIMMEFGFLLKETKWNNRQMSIRASYDAFRILNIVDEVDYDQLSLKLDEILHHVKQ